MKTNLPLDADRRGADVMALADIRPGQAVYEALVHGGSVDFPRALNNVYTY